MKKNITTALFCALTFSTAQAQEALIQAENIFVVPGAITANGTPVFASIEEDGDNGTQTIRIYDENFNVSKTLSQNFSKCTSKSWTEVATVTITGLQQQSIDTYATSLGNEVDLSNVNTGVQLANALNQYYGYDSDTSEKFIGFTDSEGFPGCYRNSDYSFKYPELFGRDYLDEYYRLQNGLIHRVDISYNTTYDEENADWVQDGSVSESPYYYGITGLYLDNFDGGGSSSNVCSYCSQSLFNDDSSWEIIVPILEEQTSQGNAWEYSSVQGNKVTLKRNCSSRYDISGYKVLNENGAEIMTIDRGESNSWSEISVIRANGKNYLKIWESSVETLYSIEPSGNSVKLNEVARRRLTNVGDGIIDVNTDGESGQVLLTNMAGSTVDRKTARGETVVRLNTRHLAKGGYNVTLQRNGRTVANEKVLVK